MHGISEVTRCLPYPLPRGAVSFPIQNCRLAGISAINKNAGRGIFSGIFH